MAPSLHRPRRRLRAAPTGAGPRRPCVARPTATAHHLATARRLAHCAPLAIPTSRAIIGGCSPHAHSSIRCSVCSTQGNRVYECPKAFFKASGRAIPGQRSNLNGTQDSTAWHNDELVPAARADLADYLRWTRVPLNRRCPVSIALIAAGP